MLNRHKGGQNHGRPPRSCRWIKFDHQEADVSQRQAPVMSSWSFPWVCFFILKCWHLWQACVSLQRHKRIEYEKLGPFSQRTTTYNNLSLLEVLCLHAKIMMLPRRWQIKPGSQSADFKARLSNVLLQICRYDSLARSSYGRWTSRAREPAALGLPQSQQGHYFWHEHTRGHEPHLPASGQQSQLALVRANFTLPRALFLETDGSDLAASIWLIQKSCKEIWKHWDRT